jgi:hypothetical protein
MEYKRLKIRFRQFLIHDTVCLQRYRALKPFQMKYQFKVHTNFGVYVDFLKFTALLGLYFILPTYVQFFFRTCYRISRVFTVTAYY